MNNNKQWIVPVSWEMCGFIKVYANSAKEAINRVLNDDSPWGLPEDSLYVEASFKPEKESEIVEMYTQEYSEGRLNSIPEQEDICL